MTFHRMTRNEEYNDFVCRTHQKSAAYEERLCTHNSIRVTVIREIVRDTLRAVNRYAIADEEGFRRRLAQEAAAYHPDDRKQLSKGIRDKEKHIARLEHLQKSCTRTMPWGTSRRNALTSCPRNTSRRKPC